jgi:hypothetical protein
MKLIKEYLDYIIGYIGWILFVLWAAINYPYNSYMIKKRKEQEITTPVTPELMDKKISDLKKFYKD